MAAGVFAGSGPPSAPCDRGDAEPVRADLKGVRQPADGAVCQLLLNAFSATPLRPIGLALRDQAWSNAVELLEWCTALVGDLVAERSDVRDVDDSERELLSTSSEVLRWASDVFRGSRALADLERLDALRRASVARIRGLDPAGKDFGTQTRVAFHANTIAMAALAVGADASVAAELVGPDFLAAARRRWFDREAAVISGRRAAVSSYSRAAARHASLRSVWFINSLRGALALSAVVAVADLTGVQHGFWVVLGTLSVLRTSAGATGVGQAAFTVTVVVLFNLLVPAGWKVGALRVEDVALGCLVSVIVGALFWPRGVSSVVGDDLADAFRSGASYLREAVSWVCGLGGEAPSGGGAAVTAGLRLDEAVRGFLADAQMPRDCASADAADRVEFSEQDEALRQWYGQLADRIARPRGNSDVVLAVPPTPGDHADVSARQSVWLGEHLDHLSDHLPALVEPSAHLAEVRRRPWWR